jgi:acyl carrier protein
LTDAGKVLEELKDIMVERLKFDPGRVSELTEATLLPKGVDGSLGLDSLDFIEMSIAIEERFGFVVDDTEDVEAHFRSFASLVEYILARRREG